MRACSGWSYASWQDPFYPQNLTNSGLDSKGGNVQTVMLANPQPVSMPYGIVTQRLDVVITRDYTILISLGQGGALTFDCNKNQILNNDILKGSWWQVIDRVKETPVCLIGTISSDKVSLG